MDIIPAEQGPNNYPIYIGANVLSSLEDIYPGRKLIVTDTNVYKLYGAYFNHIKDIVILQPGEEYKNWHSIERILSTLVDRHHDKNSTVIALGGGVINDLAGFAASIYMRGINWLSIPTTLLAQVDAAVGGKTGCNFAGLKNQIGSFYQPKLVLIDIDTVRTMGIRDYISGLAEVVKYGVVKDPKFFDWLDTNTQKIKQRDKAVLQTMIKHCCTIKRSIVAIDFTDRSSRMILNFGHTFAHALEATTDFTSLKHGEAVACGMLLATRLAVKLQMASHDLYERIFALLTELGVNFDIPPLDIGKFYDFLRCDKKANNQQLTFVLPYRLGKVKVISDIELKTIEELIAEYVGIRSST